MINHMRIVELIGWQDSKPTTNEGNTMTTTNKITLTFTQCKQAIANGADLADLVEKLNDQPAFMQFEGMGVDSIGELQSIIQCGCASDAHKSVYFYDAQKCMSEHGDEVLGFIEDFCGELPTPPTGFGWGELASHYLSYAIELWCTQFDDALHGVDWD